MTDRRRRLPRAFFERDATELAPDLLGKVLAAGGCAVRIVEVEAYRTDDPASHTHRGPTRRNATMFGPGGHLYVYFTYGMHHCANVSAGDTGDGQGVLLRAAEPLSGLALMRRRRDGRPDRQLLDGPGKLCQALGIDRRLDGADLTARGAVTLLDDGTGPPVDPLVGPRIGLRVGVDTPWRWIDPRTTLRLRRS
ncbi:MAG: DNA-3-methyladenine glycosylase [Desertimonas sp.]